MDRKRLLILVCIIFGIFSPGDTSPIASPPCRTKVCDDRPECPKSACRCLYPSKIDCSVYYHCLQGKPYQYKCSPGLLFNAETLSCDYESNVNCTYGTTTLSTSVTNTAGSSYWTTKNPLPPSTHYPTITNNPTPDGGTVTSDASNITDATSSTDFSLPSTKTTEFINITKVTDSTDFSTQDNEEPSTITFHPYDTTTGSSKAEVTTTSQPNDTSVHTYPTSDKVITADTVTTPVTIVSDPTSEKITTSNTADVTDSTLSDKTTDQTPNNIVTNSTSDKVITAQTTDVTDTTSGDVSSDQTPNTIVTNPTSDKVITTAQTADTTVDDIVTTHSTKVTNKDQTTTGTSEITPSSSVETTEINSSSETDSSTAAPTSSTEPPTGKPSTIEISSTTNGNTRNVMFECPSRFGLYADSFNCSTFHQCSHWTPYLKECPSNLHFNPILTVCDWPEAAGCGQPISTTTSKDDPTSPTPTYCECDSCDLPIPGDCDSYILCIDHSAMVIDCGEGLSYNPLTGTCDFRDRVQCDDTVVVQCPQPSGRFPYPRSCSHYMECRKSAMTVTKCPEEMVYDQETGNCSLSAVCGETTWTKADTTTEAISTLLPTTSQDTTFSITDENDDQTTELTTQKTQTPTSVRTTVSEDISPSDSTTTSTGEENETTEKTQPSTELSTTTKSENTQPSGGTITPTKNTITSTSTTEDDSGNTTIDIEKNTDSTPITDDGGITTYSKPDEDATTKLMTEATTRNDSIPTTSSTLVANVTETKLYTPMTTYETSRQTETTRASSSSDYVTFECPSRFGLYPDSENCSRFYQCSHWEPYRKSCPSNLHFNPTVAVCDWPYRAGCNRSLPTTQEPLPTTPSEPQKKTYCDCDSCDLPVPYDCSSYLLCIEKSATLITCSEGLSYNAMSGMCDFEENVECDPVECPGPTGVFPYPHSCVHYIECENGDMAVKRCPGEWKFDVKGLNCTTSGSCGDTDTSSETTTSVGPTRTTTSDENSSTQDSEVVTETVTPERNSFTNPVVKSTETSPTTGSTEKPTTGVSAETSTTELTSEDRDPVTKSTSDLPSSDRDTTPVSTTTISQEIITTVKTDEPFSISSSSVPTSTLSTDSTANPIIQSTEISPTTEPSEKSTTFVSIETSTTEITSEDKDLVTDSTSSLPSSEIDTTISQEIITTVKTDEPYSPSISSEQTSTPSTEDVDQETTKNTPTSTIFKSSTSISTSTATAEYTTVPGTTIEKSSTTGANRTSIGPSDFQCPFRFGLFPDSENCFKFYHCSHWIAHHKRCPSDLHFNPTLQVCDWPYRAGCGEQPVLTTTPEDNSALPNTDCYCECCFMPNKNDCSKYHLCLDGRTHEGQCASGLLFNPLNSNCDLAERVNCSNSLIECPTRDGVVANPKNCSSFYKCTNGNPVLQQCSSGNHFSESEKLCVGPCKAKCDQTLDCPDTHSTQAPKSEICIEDEALYRASNCSSFYQCVEGQAYLVQCPYGLHFNIEYGVCEHPCDAQCDPNIECKHRSPRSLRCPSLYGLFPAPHDCGSFYMCSEGLEHEIHCPPGLHFNPKSETCEEPCKAGCNKTACKSSINTSKSMTLQNPDYYALSPHCKAPNGTYANPKDCGSFYQCENGTENLVYCPIGLHYSVQDRTCESPCVANCDTDIDDCPTKIPNQEGNCTCQDCFVPDPTDCSAFYFCSQRHLTKSYCPYGTLFDIHKNRCEPESVAKCAIVVDPALCSNPFGFDPYPGDCGKFVHCVDSIAYVKECEQGLEFDPVVRACANPNGRCGRKKTDSTCLTPSGAFPHQNNSSLFYQCENGVSYLKECPFPLIFNIIEEVCDWPLSLENEGQSNIHRTQPRRTDKCNEVPGVICPCACRVTTYDECNSFYHCQHDGTACKKFCPEGLYFNKRKMICDLPENVECRDFFFTAMNKLRSWN